MSQKFTDQVIIAMLNRNGYKEDTKEKVRRQMDMHSDEIGIRMLQHYIEQYILKYVAIHGEVSEADCHLLFDNEELPNPFEWNYIGDTPTVRASIPGMKHSRPKAGACIGILPKNIVDQFPDVPIEKLCDKLVRRWVHLSGSVIIANVFSVDAVCCLEYDRDKHSAEIEVNFMPNNDVSIYTDEFIDMQNIDPAYKTFFKVFYKAYREAMVCADRLKKVKKTMKKIYHDNEYLRDRIRKMTKLLIKVRIDSWSVDEILDNDDTVDIIDLKMSKITEFLFGNTYIPDSIKLYVKDRIDRIYYRYSERLDFDEQIFESEKCGLGFPDTNTIFAHDYQMMVTIIGVETYFNHIRIKYRFLGMKWDPLEWCYDYLKEEDGEG